MANEEHLAILRKGVEEWNQWRKEHPDERPDLVEAPLNGANLRGVDFEFAHLRSALLSGADLSGASTSLVNVLLYKADLIEANLIEANLVNAHLVGADLSGADLSGANLSGANLVAAKLCNANLQNAKLVNANSLSANLRGADLRGANLGGTNFSLADLSDAKLGQAVMLWTTLADIDLSHVTGLESVDHHGPSSVSTSTLERSRGQIPEDFLRGCGFSPEQIVAAKDWPGGPPKVFISYTREDEAFVEALERRFDEKGVRHWRDVHDLKAGRLERQIDRAITLYPLVLLVLSERSVLSDWVRWEAERARKLEQEYEKAGEPRDVLCPVALDDAWESCRWPGPLRQQIKDYHVLDFSGWKDDEEMGRQFTKLYEGMVLNYGRKGGARAG